MWKEHDEDSTEEYSDTSIDNGAPKIGYDTLIIMMKKNR